MKISTLIVICLIGFLSDRSASQTILVTVSPYMTLQNYEHFKRLTLTCSDPTVEFIEGFSFEWGYSYQLKVRKEVLKNTLSDGTKYRFIYEKEVSKTEVPDTTTFKLMITPQRYFAYHGSSEQHANEALKPIGDGLFCYLNAVEIEVPEEMRLPFNKLRNCKEDFVGICRFVGGSRIKIIKLN